MSGEAGRMADAIAAADEIAGSLRMFGEWFGRPNDNIHRIVAANENGDELLVFFDGGETLTVAEPAGLELSVRQAGDPPSQPQLVIRSAARVRWQWYEYGRPKTPENLRAMEPRPDPSQAAVELY